MCLGTPLQGEKESRKASFLDIPLQGTESMKRITEPVGDFFQGALFDSKSPQGFIAPLHGVFGFEEKVLREQERSPCYDII
jgi:hypothetical protein